MNEFPRVALFADTFHEINGAANILRRLTAYAKERNHPFLCVRAGSETRSWREGALEILELKRSRASLTLNEDLQYDPLFWRYHNLINRTLNDFKPDVLHLTGVNDVSLLGFVFARQAFARRRFVAHERARISGAANRQPHSVFARRRSLETKARD